MKSFLSLVILASISFCVPAFADADQSNHVYTDLDKELPGGMTVAETLQAWDSSASRYRNEPPKIQVQQEKAAAK